MEELPFCDVEDNFQSHDETSNVDDIVNGDEIHMLKEEKRKAFWLGKRQKHRLRVVMLGPKRLMLILRSEK